MDNMNENNEELTAEELKSLEKIVNKLPRKKKGGRFLSIVLALAVGFLTGVVYERADSSNGVLVSRKIEKLNKLIKENYYFTDKINIPEATENAYGAYVASMGDRFTYYVPPSSIDDFNQNMTGEYAGVGVEVTVDSDNQIVVTRAFENGPAKEAGIEAGDVISEVEGEKYDGDHLSDAVSVLKGHTGQSVNIKIYDLSEETYKDVSVIRRAVTAETVDSEILEDNIGYIKISNFGDTTANEFKTHFDKLVSQNISGLVIDLRNNGGGTLDSVVKIADTLMPEGQIVKIKYRNKGDEVYNSDASCFDKKIAVLVNENTASASELLTGALRDINGAAVVGKNTFGKGVVGTVYPIDSESTAVITTGEYFLPCGDNIHGVGIKPTAEVDLPDNVKNIYLLDRKDDTQLMRAIYEIKQ